ncbi:MAG TPA: hypothetical protein DCR77_06640 [Flavobacteriaceae bacterium]|nr:hypothetical protein [Flavobacteriaceae bacterium]
MNNIENSELYQLEKSFDKFIKEFPRARLRLCKNTGKKLYDKVIENIDRDVKEETGNLRNGVTIVIGSGGGYAAVKAEHKLAPHTHLVENGHRIVTGYNPSKSAKKYHGAVDTRKDTGDWVPGKHMYRNALNELVFELENDAQQTLYDLVGEMFG